MLLNLDTLSCEELRTKRKTRTVGYNSWPFHAVEVSKYFGTLVEINGKGGTRSSYPRVCMIFSQDKLLI